MRRRFALIAALSILILSAMAPAAAQDGPQAAAGSTTIHVVQRDETLFLIALQYGTTVDAISEANGITDPRYITVGQRLLIPNANASAPGAVTTYEVMPGDSLESLARRFDSTVAALAQANYVTNPALIYIGQDMTISQGSAEGAAGPSARALYHAEQGETPARVAVRFGVHLNDLLAANGLKEAQPLFAGERLWIPGDKPAGGIADLPPAITSLTINPVPVMQGKTFSVHLTTDGRAGVDGSFMGYPIQVVTEDGNQHYAVFGVHPFAAAGVYPMTLNIALPGRLSETFTFRIRVDDGGYSTETIELGEGQDDLLNPAVTEPEWERVARAMSTFTTQRRFDGLMGLPSTGAITSEFGTRRDYNEGALDTFHSGTDFGGAPGSPVVAPAAGVVVLADNLPVRGNATIIDHGWGVVTGYWHQSEIKVSVGDVVTPGEVIGLVGTTGRSTGPHLHWEMWVGGVQVDPMQWVRQTFP